MTAAKQSTKLNQQIMPRKLEENPAAVEHFMGGWNYCQ